MKSIRTIDVGIAILVSGLGIFCASCKNNSETAISVEQEPPVVTTKNLTDPEVLNAKAPASDHEIAHTDWIFSINPYLDYSIEKEQKDKDGYRIWLKVTGIKLKLKLPITTYISPQTPAYVVDHERGHQQICRRIYSHCREYALKGAQEVIGKQFEGFGADRKLAIGNALQFAGQDLTSPYRGNASARADAVSSIYDQLCEKEDRKNLVDKTVNDAFLLADKESK